MNVSLSPELENFVQTKVRSGRYNSPSEVVGEALQLLREREHIRQEIRQKIDEGWQSLERGEGFDGEAVFTELEAELDDIEKTLQGG